MPEFQVGLEVITPSSIDDISLAFYDLFDGVVAERDGRVMLLAYIESRSAMEAAYELIGVLESQLDVSVCRVDRDMVDASEIARRLGVERQTVHLWATGGRKSAFPAPIGFPGGRRVWTWSQVVAWGRDNDYALDDDLGLMPDAAAQVDAYLAKRREKVVSGARTVEWSVGPGTSKNDYEVETRQVKPVTAGRS